MASQLTSLCLSLTPIYLLTFSLGDDQQVQQKAFQTVVAGQQAENLLNFDDPASDEQQPSGIAATAALAATPAAASLLAGTSSNPLDDLVSIFGNVGLGSGPSAPQQNGMGAGAGASLGGLSFDAAPIVPSTAQITSPVQTQPPPTQAQQPQDDLLGLF